MLRGEEKKNGENFDRFGVKKNFLFQKLYYFMLKQNFICSFSFHLLILINKGTKFF
jgi:hypothetical protein